MLFARKWACLPSNSRQDILPSLEGVFWVFAEYSVLGVFSHRSAECLLCVWSEWENSHTSSLKLQVCFAGYSVLSGFSHSNTERRVSVSVECLLCVWSEWQDTQNTRSVSSVCPCLSVFCRRHSNVLEDRHWKECLGCTWWQTLPGVFWVYLTTDTQRSLLSVLEDRHCKESFECLSFYPMFSHMDPWLSILKDTLSRDPWLCILKVTLSRDPWLSILKVTPTDVYIFMVSLIHDFPYWKIWNERYGSMTFHIERHHKDIYIRMSTPE